jgi:hypothetical protein
MTVRELIEKLQELNQPEKEVEIIVFPAERPDRESTLPVLSVRQADFVNVVLIGAREVEIPDDEGVDVSSQDF